MNEPQAERVGDRAQARVAAGFYVPRLLPPPLASGGLAGRLPQKPQRPPPNGPERWATSITTPMVSLHFSSW